MAALAYFMSTDLLAVEVESLEEAYSCLRGGALRHGKDAEAWLTWVLDGCMERKSGRQAPALHLLACTLPRCPVSAGVLESVGFGQRRTDSRWFRLVRVDSVMCWASRSFG